jgi:hypothetical protein
MCWYKKYLFYLFSLVIFTGAQSCKNDSHGGADTRQFFDLKKFFAAESTRLTKLHPLINKTAIHNANKETKKINVPDWNAELSLFSESDINKPAWKASYTSSTSEGITTYRAIDPDLRTRSVVVKKENNKVKLILIYNYTKTNLFGKALYWTTEELIYVPDSMYRKQKRQFVRILGENRYFVKGLFN